MGLKNGNIMWWILLTRRNVLVDKIPRWEVLSSPPSLSHSDISKYPGDVKCPNFFFSPSSGKTLIRFGEEKFLKKNRLFWSSKRKKDLHCTVVRGWHPNDRFIQTDDDDDDDEDMGEDESILQVENHEIRVNNSCSIHSITSPNSSDSQYSVTLLRVTLCWVDVPWIVAVWSAKCLNKLPQFPVHYVLGYKKGSLIQGKKTRANVKKNGKMMTTDSIPT